MRITITVDDKDLQDRIHDLNFETTQARNEVREYVREHDTRSTYPPEIMVNAEPKNATAPYDLISKVSLNRTYGKQARKRKPVRKPVRRRK